MSIMGSFHNLLVKIKLKRHLKSQAQFIDANPDAHFYNSFRMAVIDAKANIKYLKIDEGSILDCMIHIETGEGQVVVGKNCWIGNSRIICKEKIEFGDNVFVSYGINFFDHDSHSVNYHERQKDLSQQLNNHNMGRPFLANKNWDVVNTKPIKVNSNAWIGMNCIILKGVTIGEGAIVGAGSVVTKDVPAWTIVAGNPAQVVKNIREINSDLVI